MITLKYCLQTSNSKDQIEEIQHYGLQGRVCEIKIHKVPSKAFPRAIITSKPGISFCSVQCFFPIYLPFRYLIWLLSIVYLEWKRCHFYEIVEVFRFGDACNRDLKDLLNAFFFTMNVPSSHETYKHSFVKH